MKSILFLIVLTTIGAGVAFFFLAQDEPPVVSPVAPVVAKTPEPNPRTEKTTPPRPMSRQAPKYPVELKKQGIEGSVEVRALVDSSGMVLSTEVKTSSGHESMDLAACQAVERWYFTPAESNNKPVEAHVAVKINFKLRAS